MSTIDSSFGFLPSPLQYMYVLLFYALFHVIEFWINFFLIKSINIKKTEFIVAQCPMSRTVQTVFRVGGPLTIYA